MSSSNFQNIQYKASNGQINLDEAQGIVECFVAGIGNKDSVGDICVSGAFTKSLQRRKPRVVWGHNWNDPIGKVLEIYEVPANDPRLPMKMKMAGIGGLYARVQFNLQSEKGREAFANVAFFGEEQEWSIGYKTLRSQFDDKLQANILYEVELYEVSPVLHGANQLTGTISVKSDEEKMHGMMPMMPTAPQKPSADGVFDEGLAKPVSGPALAALMVELSRRAGGTIEIIEANENSVVFKKPGKGKFRISYHFNGSEYMFGKPELIAAETPARMESGPSPIVGVTAKPGMRTGITVSKPPRNLPATPMPVAVKPSEEGEGMVVVPLPKVQYDQSGKKPSMQPVVVAEEQELADALTAIAEKYGKFNEDGTGVWAGYTPASENENADIGVKCSNCILYQGGGKCKIIARDVEPEGSCRFAVIPDNVVQVGDKKKRYMDAMDDSELDMVAELEEKYPGEFVLGVVRGLAKRKKKRKRFGMFKSLDQFGIEEAELEAKGLDPFLAQESSYLIPVNIDDAFDFKSFIDPVLDYHRIDTTVTEHGIVINSPLDQESKDALEAAVASASRTLKKKLDSSDIEEKALGRRARRTLGRIGGRRRGIGGRRMGMPSGDLDPRTRRDTDLDGTLFDNIPGWEQPDPTPDGPGSINNPKPSRRQMAQSKRPARKRTIQKEREKLSSGDIRRHSAMSEADEKNFPDKQEEAKRAAHEQIADMWREQGLGWTNVPRYAADKKSSSDYLRGREIGVNQDRVMWSGDSQRRRPNGFNEKAKASTQYRDWFRSYASAVSSYLDANRKPDDENWRGIESALRGGVKEKMPDTRNWKQDDKDSFDIFVRGLGFEEENLSSGRRSKPSERRVAKPARERMSSGRKINSYEDLVDESQKLDAMDRDSEEFRARAAELMKEANRLQGGVDPDSDDFDDIEEIKDEIRSFRRGGTRGLSSGRSENDVERVRQELNREGMEQSGPGVPYDSADVDNMVDHWKDNPDVHEERLAEAGGNLRRAMENEWEAELDRQLGQVEEPSDTAPSRSFRRGGTRGLSSGRSERTGLSSGRDNRLKNLNDRNGEPFYVGNERITEEEMADVVREDEFYETVTDATLEELAEVSGYSDRELRKMLTDYDYENGIDTGVEGPAYSDEAEDDAKEYLLDNLSTEETLQLVLDKDFNGDKQALSKLIDEVFNRQLDAKIGAYENRTERERGLASGDAGIGSMLGDMRTFRRIESGESTADIAKELGVDELEVKKAAARGRMFRAVFRGRGEQPEFGSGHTFREIFNRTQKGESISALAREFDVPESEIKKAVANGRFLEAVKRTPGEKLSSGATDRETFKRVRDGESTRDIANEMGIPEIEVKKSVARGRLLESINRTDGTGLSSGARDEEFDANGYPLSYKDYIDALQKEEDVDLEIYERRMAGQSIADIAEELGVDKERVRQGEMAHARRLMELDREAEEWQKRWGDFTNPLEGIKEGERLSSGKMDEVYATVQQSLVKMLETADPKDWSFPWHKTGMLPNNPTNKKRPYTGSNMMFLLFAQQQNGYSTAMWAGFKQWSAMGGKVRKGEKGTPVLIPKVMYGEDENGERKAKGLYFSVAYVFNADQVEGESVEALKKEALDAPQLSDEERVAELESALSEIGAVVNTGGNEAFYRPSTDEITMPPFSNFKSGVQYYATYAHEMMHWTGHSSRLNRPNLNRFGSPEYAKEELVAEIASAFFLSAVGLTPEPREDHAQYLQSWLRALKSDPDALKNAFTEAQKAADFAIGKSPSLSKKLGKKVAESDISDATGSASYPDVVPDPEVAEKLSSGLSVGVTDVSMASDLDIEDNEVARRLMKESLGSGRVGYSGPAKLSSAKGPNNDGVWHVINNGDNGVFVVHVGPDGRFSEISSPNLNDEVEASRWIASYEIERQNWFERFKAEQDVERLAEMVAEENNRRQREIEEANMLSLQRGGSLEFSDIIGLNDPEKVDWTPEDWNKEAQKLRSESLSSGARSNRYDEIDPDNIVLTTDAMRRTDEIGSNTRYIAEYLNDTPSDVKNPTELRSGDPISFTYAGKKRILYPTAILVKKGGGIRVLGLDDEADDWRTYRIDRIDGLIDGAPYPQNPRTPGIPSSERMSSGLTGRLGEAENAIARIVKLHPVRRNVARNDANVDEVEEQLNQLIEARSRLARRIAQEKGQVIDAETTIYDLAGLDDDDALDALELLDNAVNEHGYWLEQRESIGNAIAREEQEAIEKLSDIEDKIKEVNDARGSDEEMDAIRSAFEYLDENGTLLSGERAELESAIDSENVENSRNLIIDSLESERRLAENNFREAEVNVDNFQMPSGRTQRYGTSLYESLSSGKRKRPDSSRRMPWSAEERQLYADRNILRSKKRPGKRKGGPTEEEFSSGRRLRMPSTERRRAVGDEMRRKIQMKAKPLSENDIRKPDGPWILPSKPLLDLMVDERGAPLPDDEIIKTLGITPVELKKMREDGMGISEVDAYAFVDRMFDGDAFTTAGILEDMWGFESAPYWTDRWGRNLDRDGYLDAKEEGIMVTGLFAPPDYVSEDDATVQVAGYERKDFSIEKFAQMMGIEDWKENDDALRDALTMTVQGVERVPTRMQLKKYREDGIPTVVLERLIETGKIRDAESVFGAAGRAFDNEISKFELWENLNNAITQRGAKFSGPEFSEIVGKQKALQKLKEYLKGKEENPPFSNTSTGRYDENVGKAPRYTPEEVGEILSRAKNVLDVDIPLQEVMPNAGRGESLSSGRTAPRSRANTRKIKQLSEVEPYDYPKEKYSPTEEQRKVADAIMTGDDVVVRALAGSGKTSTLVATARRLEDQDPEKRIIYIVFQKSNQIDAQKRFKGIKNTEVRTADSIAYVSLPKGLTQKANREYAMGAKLLPWKRKDEIARIFNVPGVVIQGDEYSPKDSVALLKKVVDNFVIGTDKEITAKNFIGKHTKLDVDEKDIPAELVEAAQRIWDDIANPNGGIMASKRGYLVKLWAFTEPDLGTGDGMKQNSSGNDIIFFDEAQDQNTVLSELIRKQGIQKVLVGDSNQAIFGFRGAVDELDKANAPYELYLTGSFRFGKQIAGVANRFLALMGRKERVDGKGPEGEIVQTVQNPDAILTRSNGGALRAIVQSLEEGKTVGVNKSFKTNLDQFINTVAWLRDGAKKPDTISEELEGFDTWKEVQEAAEKDDNPRLKMLLKLVEEYGTSELNEILNRITILPDNEPEFSTEQDGVFRNIARGINYSFENGVLTIDGGYTIREKLKAGTPRFRFVKLPPLEKGGKERNYWQAPAPASAKGRAELLAKVYEYAGVEAPDISSEQIDVRVQTAHSAKGMEFGSVQIYDDFPKPKIDRATKQIEMPSPEEMRLAYVAVTRAMKTLGTGGLSWIFNHTTDSDEEYVSIDAD